jgi:hypothetical protein
MKTIWAAGAGVLLLGLAGCGNTTLKNLEADAGGRDISPPPNGLASLYVYRDSDTGAGSMATAWVDGRIVGTLGSHSWLTVGASPGPHQIGCTNGDQINVTVAQGQIRFIEFVVRDNGHCAVFETPNDRGRAGVSHGKRVAKAASAPS